MTVVDGLARVVEARERCCAEGVIHRAVTLRGLAGRRVGGRERWIIVEVTVALHSRSEAIDAESM